MERPSTIGRIVSKLILIALAALSLLSCERDTSARISAARKFADDYFRLKDFDENGVFFRSFSSQSETRPDFAALSPTLVSPDLSSFLSIDFISRGSEDFIVVREASAQGSRAELSRLHYRLTELPDAVVQVEWSSSDGSTVFLWERGALYIVAFCGERVARVPVAKDVRFFVATSDRVYFSRNDSPKVLRWRSLPGITGEAGLQSLPDLYDQIDVGPSPSELLVYKGDLRDGGKFIDFRLIDTSNNTSRTLPIDDRFDIIDLETIKGTSRAVVEIRRRNTERMDGSISTFLALLDYANGSLIPLVDDAGSLHVRPANIYLLRKETRTAVCGRR